MKRVLIEDVTDDELAELTGKLRAYNRAQKAYRKCTSYLLNYKTERGELIGGIAFEIRGQWLDINFLFVESDQRTRGIGSALLQEAETLARQKGCRKAFVDTFGFQAKPFYEKHGYREVYVQEYEEEEANRYYLEKSLQ